MLSKIIKHEIKGTWKFNTVLTAVFAFILIVTRLSLIPYTNNNGRGIGMLYLAFVIIALIVFLACLIVYNLAPLIYSIVRFYRTSATKEGYLTFMLPVSTDKIILGKLITAVMWQTLSGAVSIISVIFFLVSLGLFDPYIIGFDLYSALSSLYNYSPADMILFISAILLSALVTAASGILKAYGAVSIGQCFERNKVIASILIYFGFNIIYSVILNALGIGFAIELNLLSSPAEFVINILRSAVMPVFLSVIYELCFASLYYFVTRYFIKNKLNLS